MFLEDVFDDIGIGHPGNFDIREVVFNLEAFLERAVQRKDSCVTRVDQSSVDIEKKKTFHENFGFRIAKCYRSDDANQKSEISNLKSAIAYRGRLAPSPTGYLHIGHGCTFWQAQERARKAGGQLVLRIEDLDEPRCRPEFRDAIIEDLSWFGLQWDEGPDVRGPFAPYVQSERRSHYLDVLRKLWDAGAVYGCACSRKDVAEAATAPHAENEEPIYPGMCRALKRATSFESLLSGEWNVRFHVPDGETVRFRDGRAGEQAAIAGKDFGDFVVWRRDDVPAYHLAVVADDIAMHVTEVVRGEDLLLSTFRHLLLYRAVRVEPPAFYHAQLIADDEGRRLAKRHASLSLRMLRQSGVHPEALRGGLHDGLKPIVSLRPSTNDAGLNPTREYPQRP